MPYLRPRTPTPTDPIVLLSPAPGSEMQRSILYQMDRGRLNKSAWRQTTALVGLLQSLHQTPFTVRSSRYRKISALEMLQRSATGTPSAAETPPLATG